VVILTPYPVIAKDKIIALVDIVMTVTAGITEAQTKWQLLKAITKNGTVSIQKIMFKCNLKKPHE